MEYRKYKFSSAQWRTLRTLIEEKIIDGSRNEISRFVNCDVVDLGLEIATPATINTNGNIIVPATYTDNVRVDILWHVTPLSQFTPYEVWPVNGGSHMFAGLENVYEACYNNRTV